MLALTGAFVMAQVIAVAFLVGVRAAKGDRFDPEALKTDGVLLSVGMIVSTPVMLGLSWLFIRLRRGPTVINYLALRPFGWKDGLLGAVWLGVLWVLSAWLNPEPSEWMVKTWRNAGPLPLFVLAVIVLAPLVEEVVYRGFAFTGLAEGRFGAWGAIALTTLVWSALHVQYGWKELLFVAALGVLLGWLRKRSGSLWLPMAIHLINNLASTIALAWMVSQQD